MYKYDIAASIVAYKNDPATVNNAVKSFLDTYLSVSIVIIDNSPTDILSKDLLQDERVNYVFNGCNVGFSKAHNQGIQYYQGQAKYFLVLNPDVYFDGTTLDTLFHYLESDSSVGLIAPRILYPDGDTQVSRRLIPSPADLFIRRIPFGSKLFCNRRHANEYQDVDDEHTLEVPFLLGCFLLLRMSAISKVGMFDERYFVYLEDLDFCRRMLKHYKVVYHGKASIYHYYQRASSKNLKMFILHSISMVKYFNKWGWLNDTDRKKINSKATALKRIKEERETVSFTTTYAASF